jgi:hypothetical protein
VSTGSKRREPAERSEAIKRSTVERKAMTELLELRGVVEAGSDAVADVLLDVRPGGRSPLARDGTIEEDDGAEFVLSQNGS